VEKYLMRRCLAIAASSFSMFPAFSRHFAIYIQGRNKLSEREEKQISGKEF
jgi:hypothetical protein